MATEKVGIYRRWLGPVPLENGKPIPKAQWPEKRRHSWTVRWFGTNGERYSKDLKTKKLAERYARDLRSQIEIGAQDRPTRITLHDFIGEHLKVMCGQVAYATLADQKRALKLFEKSIGGSIKLHQIRPRQAEAFVAARLAHNRAVATVNKDIRTLRRVFNLAINPRGYVAEGQNPFTGIKERKASRKSIHYVKIEEYESLLNAADKLWWRALVAVAYGSGLRRREILNLTWMDIDFEEQQIRVEPKNSTAHTIEWEPKDHEQRVVPMSDDATQLLADLQAESKVGFPYIFITPRRFALIKKHEATGHWHARSEEINNLSRDFDVIQRRANVRRCTLHDLRRSAITNWAQKLPIQVVQQLAGHSSINTTRKYYIAVRPEDIALANEIVSSIRTAAAKKRLTQN